MQEIMIAIVLGIAVGCSDLLNYNVKKWLSRFSTVSLFIMLLCLGAKIGCDAELLGKLDQLGGKSLVMAVYGLQQVINGEDLNHAIIDTGSAIVTAENIDDPEIQAVINPK